MKKDHPVIHNNNRAKELSKHLFALIKEIDLIDVEIKKKEEDFDDLREKRSRKADEYGETNRDLAANINSSEDYSDFISSVISSVQDENARICVITVLLRELAKRKLTSDQLSPKEYVGEYQELHRKIAEPYERMRDENTDQLFFSSVPFVKFMIYLSNIAYSAAIQTTIVAAAFLFFGATMPPLTPFLIGLGIAIFNGANAFSALDMQCGLLVIREAHEKSKIGIKKVDTLPTKDSINSGVIYLQPISGPFYNFVYQIKNKVYKTGQVAIASRLQEDLDKQTELVHDLNMSGFFFDKCHDLLNGTGYSDDAIRYYINESFKQMHIGAIQGNAISMLTILIGAFALSLYFTTPIGQLTIMAVVVSIFIGVFAVGPQLYFKNKHVENCLQNSIFSSEKEITQQDVSEALVKEVSLTNGVPNS